MTDTRYPVSGSIRIWWMPTNGAANWKAPTEAEMSTAIDISDAVSWNDKDFGVQASNTVDDPAITAIGNTQNRGAAQYGGSLSFYYPGEFNDPTNLYSDVFDAMRLPGTQGYLYVRVDGLQLGVDTGTAAQPGRLAKAGDLINAFRVESGGYTENITGEEAFRYTVSFLPKGQVYTFAVVREAATPVLKPITTIVKQEADYAVLSATLGGRKYTRGVKWSTATPTIVSVSANGIASRVNIGEGSIIATDPATGEASAPLTVEFT